MRLAIGAIFRNEFDYILEWLCWHEMAGFDDFYIADNGSTDGSRELLEALADLRRIKLVYQPVIESGAQIVAYSRIAQISLMETDAILYIDGDEFLTHDSMVDGAEYAHLMLLLERRDVGMVGINWRCFGSSGQQKQDDRPVLERFTWAASDYSVANNHIKSISKTNLIASFGPHASLLSDGFYIKPDSKIIDDFIVMKDGEVVPARHAGRTQSITVSPLRVNHYLIKSLEEFLCNKAKRGNAMQGINHIKTMDYFRAHDFKEVKFVFPDSKICRLKSRITNLAAQVQRSTFGKTLKGVLDRNDSRGVRGWLVDEAGDSKDLKVNIFVNQVFVGSAWCGFYRADLKQKNISLSGFSGFRWDHPNPLCAGDTVEVCVHANRFKFDSRSCAIIK